MRVRAVKPSARHIAVGEAADHEGQLQGKAENVSALWSALAVDPLLNRTRLVDAADFSDRGRTQQIRKALYHGGHGQGHRLVMGVRGGEGASWVRAIYRRAFHAPDIITMSIPCQITGEISAGLPPKPSGQLIGDSLLKRETSRRGEQSTGHPTCSGGTLSRR